MKLVLDQTSMGRVSKSNARATRQPAATAAGPTFDLSRIAVHRSEVERATAPPVVARSLASPGEAIPDAMSARFGAAFGDVRVHRDGLAREAAAAVGASAFTVGRHVVMGEGAHDERTLAHELVHTAQQGFAEPRGGALSIGDPQGVNERAADRGAERLLGGAPLGPIASAPVQVSRAPKKLHISIIGVGPTAVPARDRNRIVAAAKKALAATTKSSDDKRIKAGVDITYYQGVSEVEKLRKRGDIVVFVINGAKTDEQRGAAVRDILKVRGWDTDKRNKSTKDDKLADDVLDLSQLLHDDRGVFHRRSGTSVVDISDLKQPLTAGNDTSIAGTVLHEGIGHPAQLEDHGTHVMSADAPGTAKPEDIVFDSEDEQKVNEHLKNRLDQPDWDFQ